MGYPQNLDAFDVLTDINETNIAIINEYNRLLGIAKNSMTQADFKKADDYYATNESVLKKVIPRASYFNLITDAIKEIEKYVITTKEQILVRDIGTNYTDKSKSDYDETLANQAVGDIWIVTCTVDNLTQIYCIRVKNEQGNYNELYSMEMKTYYFEINDDNIKTLSSPSRFHIVSYSGNLITYNGEKDGSRLSYLSINNAPLLKNGDSIIIYNNSSDDIKINHILINNEIYLAFYSDESKACVNASGSIIPKHNSRQYWYKAKIGKISDALSTGMIVNSEILVNGLVENSVNYYIDYDGEKYDFTNLKEIYNDIYSSENYFNSSVTTGLGVTINNFTSRIVCGNTYSIHGDITINITNSNIENFNNAFNTFGEIEHGWNKIIKPQRSNAGFSLTQNQYLGVFRMYDANGMHEKAPEYCTLGITTDGYIALSGGNRTFTVGENWRIPFDFTFTVI